MQTITNFFENNKVAIVDFCFNSGYAVAAVISYVVISFFFYLYFKNRYNFNIKEAFDYLREKIIDYFMMILLIYFAYAGGVQTGLSDSAVIFDTMSVYVFALFIIPAFIAATFSGIFIAGLFEKFLKRRHLHDGTESIDICDIPDSSSGGFCDDTGFPDD